MATLSSTIEVGATGFSWFATNVRTLPPPAELYTHSRTTIIRVSSFQAQAGLNSFHFTKAWLLHNSQTLTFSRILLALPGGVFSQLWLSFSTYGYKYVVKQTLVKLPDREVSNFLNYYYFLVEAHQLYRGFLHARFDRQAR